MTAAPLGSDTRDACWLCDRAREELCHVHELTDADDEAIEVAWSRTATEANE